MGIITDSTSDFDAATMNKFQVGDTRDDSTIWGCVIRYTGSTWEVQAAFGCDGNASDITLTWNAVNNRLEIEGLNSLTAAGGLSFNEKCAVVCTSATGPSAANLLYPVADSFNNDKTVVQFYYPNAASNGWILETTQSTDMRFNIFFCAKIA